MLTSLEIGDALASDQVPEYERILRPIWNSLIHSNASAEIAVAISRFLGTQRELSDGTEDFLGITMINSADRVVLSCTRLFERRTDSHHFTHVADWLRGNCRPEVRARIEFETNEVLSLFGSHLVARAKETRNKLIAHMDRAQVLSPDTVEDLRLTIADVSELQRKTEVVFSEFNFGNRWGFRPLLMDNGHVHEVLRLISEHLEYHPDTTT